MKEHDGAHVGVDWGAEVVDQIESHWRDQLRPRLVGLEDDELAWDGGGLVDGERVTTIGWRLAHVTDGLDQSNRAHFGGPETSAEEHGGAATADVALRRLDDAFARWIDGVRLLGESGLATAQGPTSPPAFADEPMARLILYTSVEIIHHGAEVCLLRDLYRESRAGRPLPPGGLT